MERGSRIKNGAVERVRSLRAPPRMTEREKRGLLETIEDEEKEGNNDASRVVWR